ncbi:MAG: hypothetical protein MMC33_008675 [Icmadophila ericetorum]|nr:hypothetical protein [Icmadophila ericetorum]
MIDTTAQICIGLNVLGVILITIAVALRMYAQRLIPKPLQIDDCFIILALVLIWATSVPCIIAATILGGNAQREPSNYIMYNKCIFALQLLYITSVAVVKASILHFYKRIFTTKKFKIAVNCALAAVLLWFLGFFLLNLFGLWPISSNWDSTVKRKFDVHGAKANISLGASDTLLDIATLVLPWPMIWKLQMSRRRRWLISGIFLFSSLACVASALRLYSLVPYEESHEISLAYSGLINIFTWSAVEVVVGVICACLPIMGPIFRKHSGTRRSPTPASTITLADSLSKFRPHLKLTSFTTPSLRTFSLRRKSTSKSATSSSASFSTTSSASSRHEEEESVLPIYNNPSSRGMRQISEPTFTFTGGAKGKRAVTEVRQVKEARARGDVEGGRIVL